MMRPTTSSAKYSHSRRFLPSCLLFFLLFFHRRSQGRRQREAYGCPSTSCGNISIISYPFRLRGESSACSTDPLPLFELVCEANNAVLYDDHENKYYVKEISYDNMTLRLVDAEVASGDCRLPRKNFSDDMDTLFNGTGLSLVGYTEWVTFVSCSREIINGTWDSPYIPLPCLSTNDTNIVYAIFAYRADRLIYLEPSCHFTRNIRLTHAEYTPYHLEQYSDVFKLLQKGFLLTWDPDTYRRWWRKHHIRRISSCIRETTVLARLSPPLTMLERMFFLLYYSGNFLICLGEGRHHGTLFYLGFCIAVILAHIVLIHCIVRFIVAPGPFSCSSPTTLGGPTCPSTWSRSSYKTKGSSHLRDIPTCKSSG